MQSLRLNFREAGKYANKVAKKSDLIATDRNAEDGAG